jgi:hypothetical protein
MGEAMGVEYWRQLDIVKPEEFPHVTVVGVGGIGSFTVLALAKMGVQHMTVYDPDTVENHNVPNQLYRISDIGALKARAISQVCEQFTGYFPACFNVKIARDSAPSLSSIVVSGVDSMAARKEIWELVKYQVSVPLYVEARMGAEVMRIHSVHPCDPDEVKWYETTLYDDAQALQEPCTARAIIYTGFAIAAFIASQVKKHVKGEPLMKEIIFDMKTLTLLTQ